MICIVCISELFNFIYLQLYSKLRRASYPSGHRPIPSLKYVRIRFPHFPKTLLNDAPGAADVELSGQLMFKKNILRFNKTH